MKEPLHQLSPYPRASRAQAHVNILDAYSHGASLFHAYEYHQAIKTYRQLMRQQQDLVNQTVLWFNIGVLRDHLGEHALAAEAYERAVKLDKSFTIGWFSLGNALSLLSNYRRALRVFKICEKTFQGDSIDYRGQGLPWTLEKTRVVFNIRQTAFRKLHKQHKAPLDQVWSLNRLPAGKIFEPAIPKEGENTNSSLDLREPHSAKLVEPQDGAAVESPPAAYSKLGRSATARVATLRKKLSLSTVHGKLGKATTPQVVTPRKSLSPTPGGSVAAVATPHPFAAPQNSNHRYQAVKPLRGQDPGNQISASDMRNGSVGLPNPARHLRMDSFGIFAQGQPELRRLQANATEASTTAFGA